MNEEGKEIDIDALQTEWEAEASNMEEENVDGESQDTNEEVKSEEPETTDESEPLSDESDESLSDEPTLETPSEPSKSEQPSKEQLQLEQLQKELEESKKVASIFDEIAKEAGVSKEELLARYERQKIEADAERQNVPVEFLEKQRAMEKEIEQLRSFQEQEKFNLNVGSVINKLNLSEEDVKATLDYAVENGLDPVSVNFEAIYKAANFDKLVEKQVKEARQKELTDKQKRMSQATVTHGGSAAPSQAIDEDVQAFLKQAGLYD